MSGRAVTDGLFTQGETPALIGGRCGSCARFHFPLSSTCPYCAEPETEPVELSREGRLWAWTAVTAPPPGYSGEIPYGFGVVELPEGIRIVTRLTEPDPARLELGQPMHMVLEAVGVDEEGGEVLTYAFSPQARGAGAEVPREESP
jgi:uncharacterized protein